MGSLRPDLRGHEVKASRRRGAAKARKAGAPNGATGMSGGDPHAAALGAPWCVRRDGPPFRYPPRQRAPAQALTGTNKGHGKRGLHSPASWRPASQVRTNPHLKRAAAPRGCDRRDVPAPPTGTLPSGLVSGSPADGVSTLTYPARRRFPASGPVATRRDKVYLPRQGGKQHVGQKTQVDNAQRRGAGSPGLPTTATKTVPPPHRDLSPARRTPTPTLQQVGVDVRAGTHTPAIEVDHRRAGRRGLDHSRSRLDGPRGRHARAVSPARAHHINERIGNVNRLASAHHAAHQRPSATTCWRPCRGSWRARFIGQPQVAPARCAAPGQRRAERRAWRQADRRRQAERRQARGRCRYSGTRGS